MQGLEDEGGSRFSLSSLSLSLTQFQRMGFSKVTSVLDVTSLGFLQLGLRDFGAFHGLSDVVGPRVCVQAAHFGF